MSRVSILLAVALAACRDAPPGRGPPPAGDGDTAGPIDDCVTDAEFWTDEAAPLVTSDCIACHVSGGQAASTRYVLDPGDDDASRAAIEAFVRGTEDGATLLLDKPTNQVSHGGGLRFGVLERPYAVLHELVARIGDPGACAHPGEPPVTCDDGVVRPGPTPLRRLTSTQVENTVADVFGVTLPEGLFPPTPESADFRTFATSNVVSAAGAESVLLAAEHASSALDLDAVLACGDSAESCARAYLHDTAARLYRRPPTDAEADVLDRFLDAGLDADTAVRMAVEVMLQSPQFLYLDAAATAPVADQDAVRWLDDHAIAARLAYFLTDHPPDAALREAAGRGELHTAAEVQAHALRLVATPEAADVVAAFHQDWLDLYLLDGMLKDATLHPEWGDDLVLDLRTELDLFTTEVVWYGDGRLDTLLFSDTTWVNPSLARIYGLPDPGPGWHRVQLDADRRPGALTRPAFLASHAYAATSSPVRRGAWVLEALLCEDLVPPPGVNMELPDESEEAPTIRERLEQHWTDPTCASCHVRIDPLGFGFEHYGAVGQWRDAWLNGTAVDASGSLDATAGDFDGAAEMLALVGTTARARGCYARRWFEYALGRPADPQDVCTLDTLSRRFDSADGDIRTLMVDIAVSEAFRMRTRATEGE